MNFSRLSQDSRVIFSEAFMKIPVTVKTHSVIHSEGDATPSVTTQRAEGEMEYTDERILLTYRDTEGEDELFTRLSVEGECVRLSLRGGSVSNLYFREGAEYDTVYSVAGFTFDAHVRCDRPSVKITPRGGEIRLSYEMTLGGDPRRARLLISVSPRE